MNAIILAAGAGRRLAEMGWTKPKCLLPIGSRTLLDRAFSALWALGVTDITIVVGYQQELVIQAAREANLKSQISILKFQISNLTFISNPDFATTNTLYSLWFAREHLRDDTFLLNGDLLFDPKILNLLMRHESSTLAIDVHPCGPEEVKVFTDNTGRIIRIGKDIPIEKSCGEYIGVGRLNRPAAFALYNALERMMSASGGGTQSIATGPQNAKSANLFYESALNETLGDNVVIAANIGDLLAVEIDTSEDYERAKNAPEKP